MALIAAQNRKAILTGDESLSRRPMKRIAEPLRMMGANIVLTQNEFAPIEIKPRNSIALISIEYELKIASAQLKTALILAGLYADRTSKLTGKIHSRDHTERMLKAFGVDLLCTSQEIQIKPNQKLRATAIQVPGDPSSAAFWLAAGTLVSNSEIEIQNVSLNPTRTGFLKIMLRMGAQIEVCEIDMSGEPVGHLRVKSAKLKATEIFEYEIASLIDELPLLAIVASQAEGRTTIKGAKELRAKESDRIEALAINLRRMGATIDTFEDGFTIQGPQRLKGASIDSLQDHRIAMSFSVAALIADGESQICDVDSVGISYPEFYSVLDSLRKAPEKAPREPHRDCLIETTKG